MKTILAIALLLLLPAVVTAQQPPRLIVRGDDMGYSHSGNEAIIKCYTDGIETSIEVIVPSPWFPEAVAMLKGHPKADVGIHLAITSEWDNVKWRPLTDATSLRDSNGYFLPMVYPNKNYPGKSVSEKEWRIEDMEKEFRAQIETGKRLIPQVSHVSAHMGCDRLSDSVRTMVRRLAKEYGIDIDLEEHGVQWVGYDGPSKTSAEKKASFIRMLQKLEPGKTYWFIDHPGLDGSELQAIHHIGYENVAADRQGVTDVWTSEEVKKAVKEKRIKLIGYRDLRR